jgi:hypothetical protein
MKIYAPKPNTPVVPQHRSFRRFVNKLFAHFINQQCSAEFQTSVLQKLQEIEDMIEIMAREMVRWSNQDE